MFTPTVTLSLEQYNQMNEAINALGKTVEKLNKDVLEAQQASRDFLNTVFSVEYRIKEVSG